MSKLIYPKLFLVVTFLLVPAKSVAQTYDVTLIELPAELNARDRMPFAINNNGQIVGEYVDGNTFDDYGFVYENGTVQNLGLCVSPSDINDDGDVTYRLGLNSYLYRNGSVTVLLGPNGEAVKVFSINKSAAIIGSFAAPEFAQYVTHALLITGGQSFDIGTLEGNDPTIKSYATSINDLGLIVGGSETSGSDICCAPTGDFAFVYENGVMTSLGYLDTVSGARGLNSGANDINNAGLIVGSAQERRAFQWPSSAVIWRDGQIKSLHPAIKLTSYASAINEPGDVVGGTYQPGILVTNAAWFWKGGNGTGIPLNSMIPSDAGAYLTFAHDINDSGQIICEGLKIVDGAIAFDTNFSFLLTPVKKSITLLDARGDTLKDVTVKISKVDNDPPMFTETPLGEFTTDSKGKILLKVLEAAAGDSIKISLKVHSEPAVKHKDILSTMYTVYLDNTRFDEWGAVSYDELSGDPEQEIKLDHSLFAWNLLVSIEWDVEIDYLESTEAGFRRFSNYLYDVTDGQMILDTIVILDDKRRWNEADMRIYASNMEHPSSHVDGIRVAQGRRIFLPRQWFANADASRNRSYHSFPYDLSFFDDFRTRAHEFGHYALGFYDEYKFKEGTSRCAKIKIYGYMDSPYRSDNYNFNSELSSPLRYPESACKNTEQFIFRGMSCWEYLESFFEKTYGVDGHFVPILRPSERTLPPDVNHLLGPNDQRIFTNFLNHDVGKAVQFPKYTFTPDASTFVFGIYNFLGRNPVPKASVTLIKSETGRKIYQGKTADNGLIRVLGAKLTDKVKSFGRRAKIVDGGAQANFAGSGTQVWVFGEATLGGSGISRFGNRYSTSLIGDTLEILLNELAGDYLFIIDAAFVGTDLQLRMDVVNAFSQAPSVEHESDSDTSLSQYIFTATPNGYSVSIGDSLGEFGDFTILAIDDSLSEFFVPVDYSFNVISDSTDSLVTVRGPGGSVEVDVDSTADTVMFLISSYPVIRDGLNPDARQAGEASSLIVSPLATLTGGSSQLTIHYGDSDIGDSTDIANLEGSLRVHRWDNNVSEWVLIGGSVDTGFNEVSAQIDQPGVYAAFTTDFVTDVDDNTNESLLPETIELSQNFPNPFNPTTDIRYSLSEAGQVILTVYNILGRNVGTLVDEWKPAGHHSVIWNASGLASGVYLYKLEVGRYIETKKMLLLK